MLGLPPPSLIVPAHRWTGFYVGVNGGYGSIRRCWDNINIAGIATVPSLSEGCHDADGGTVGGQLGYRHQVGPWVFGIEGQGNLANFRGASPSLVTAPGGALGFLGLPTANVTRINSFGLVTGQIGYALSRTLFYVKAGAAVTQSVHEGYLIAGNTLFDGVRDTRWGAVVGAGVEFGLTPQWSVAMEYNRLLMGRHDLRFTSAIPPINALSRIDSIRGDADIVTLRVNYRWEVSGPQSILLN